MASSFLGGIVTSSSPSSSLVTFWQLILVSLSPEGHRYLGEMYSRCALWWLIIVIARQSGVFSNQLQNCAKTFQNVTRLCLHSATIQHFSNLIIASVKKLLFQKVLHHGNHAKIVFLGHKGHYDFCTI